MEVRKKEEVHKYRKIKFENDTIYYEQGKEVYDVTVINVFGRKEIKKILRERTDIEKKEFPIREISVKELEMQRMGTTPGFVLKMDRKYYYAKIEKNLPIMSAEIIGPHKCITPICNLISRGCPKVLEKSENIERFPWITEGYETFNTNGDCFVVLQCDNHKDYQRVALDQ